MPHEHQPRGERLMSLAQTLQPLLASLLTSTRTRDLWRRIHEAKRRIGGEPHRVTAWLKLDDPYSYLLLQVLPQFLRHFDVNLKVRLLQGLPTEMYPEPELLAEYALADAERLAQYHQLSYPWKVIRPGAAEVALGNRILLGCERLPADKYLSTARQVFTAIWEHQRNKLATLAERFPPVPEPQAELEQEKALAALRQNGHFLAATLSYAGESYWGLDRLGHLTQRLQELGVARFEHDFVLNEANPQFDSDFLISDLEQLTAIRALKLPLDFYFSFRSPYSYLALQRVFALADHYQLRLTIRPVLPMVMRGLPVPRGKRFYILHDAKREALRLDLPFGRICDPVGVGVERCLALFSLAREQGLEREFLLSITRGIWAEGRNMADDDDLRPLVERAGLDWTEAEPRLADEGWRPLAAQYREELGALGLWGVPAFCLQTPQQVLSLWGQDRLWALEAALADCLRPPPTPRGA